MDFNSLDSDFYSHVFKKSQIYSNNLKNIFLTLNHWNMLETEEVNITNNVTC